MIAMSYINMDSSSIDAIEVDYVPATPRKSALGGVIAASVRLRLRDSDGSPVATVFLDMELVRHLAEVLPGLVMGHDAEEQFTKAQAKARIKAQAA